MVGQTLFLNSIFILGFLLVCLINAITLLNLREVLNVLLTKRRLTHVDKKLREIDKHCNKCLKDFENSLVFSGMAGAEAINKEMRDLVKYCEEENKKREMTKKTTKKKA